MGQGGRMIRVQGLVALGVAFGAGYYVARKRYKK